MSLQRTQALIEQCISHHLEARFGNLKSRATEHYHVPSKDRSRTPKKMSTEGRDAGRLEAEKAVDPLAGAEAVTAQQRTRSTIIAGSPSGQAAAPPPSPPFDHLVMGAHTVSTKGPEILPESPKRPPPLPPVALSELPQDLKGHAIRRPRSGSSRFIFRSLENYIIACFNGMDCINKSFLLAPPTPPTRAKSDGAMPTISASPSKGVTYDQDAVLSPLDAKTLLLGDFAENGMWWIGGAKTERSRSHKGGSPSMGGTSGERVGVKSPRINWRELQEWYQSVLTAGRYWRRSLNDLKTRGPSGLSQQTLDDECQQDLEDEFRDASLHLQRTLLKASENLLRRPGRPLKFASDCRFLLILLANPLLYPQERDYSIWPVQLVEQPSPYSDKTSACLQPGNVALGQAPTTSQSTSVRRKGGNPTNHSGIVKRILGLLANLPSECHHYLVVWFSRFSESHFRKLVDLVGSFVTYRLSRQHGRQRSYSRDPDGGLVPSLSCAGMSSSAQLHAALGITSSQKQLEEKEGTVVYSEDWQIKAAAKVMSLLFSANNSGHLRRHYTTDSLDASADSTSTASATRHRVNRYGQILPTSTFYNTLLDYSDLIADFETWESRKGKFSFCQYPMFLSIWAKIRIMEHDARRQMEIKAREAFFDSIMSRKAVSQFLVLKVRRDCLVEDSLRGVSEVVGTGQEEIKKGLRIEFINEEGIDAGGWVGCLLIIAAVTNNVLGFEKSGSSC